MIERLASNLDALARFSPRDLGSEEGKRVVADCSDAIRLELDCPQQELTGDQRVLLMTLGDLLDAPDDAAALCDMATTVRQAFGVEPRIEFRRATNADVAVAQEIVGEALGDHGLAMLLDTSDKDLLDLQAHYDARGGVFELISDASSDAAIGVVGWRPGVDGTIELKKVYLRRAARGRGIGRIAIERVIDRARALGATAVVLETAHAMTDAIRLYRQLGFRPVTGDEAGSFATLSPECEQAFRLDLRSQV